MTKFGLVGLASALVLAGCSSTAQQSEANAPVSFSACEAQSGIAPGITTEFCGMTVVNLTYGRLLAYDENGKTSNELAESVTSDDNKTWTIKLRPNLKFSDDSDLTAESFVKAWNLVVREKQFQASFFSNVEGYEPGKDMTGLKVVDPQTFTVTLQQAESDFPMRLGYIAYAPLPEVAFKDLKAYAENPVSSGPYKLTKWEHRKSYTYEVNDKYDGPRKAKNAGLEGRVYTNPDAAYNDLIAGNLDLTQHIPDSALKTFKDDLEGRAVSSPYDGNSIIKIPFNVKHFEKGEEGQLRRQAISMSINRPEVVKAIFADTKTPATDFTAPLIEGYKADLPGNEVLKFNPEKAKELWAKADAISKFDGTFKIAYNSDAGHQAWVDAVANQIKNNLNIDAAGDSYPDMKSLRDKVLNGDIQTAFRSGWSADYPSLYNFLGPIYQTGAGANDIKFSDPEFDKLLNEGLGSASKEEALKKFDAAQEILFRELPSIPLWYQSVNGGWSNKIDNVKFGWDSQPLYWEITKK
ncbi:ABC transporter substrate-binding protein [Boudabousia liubingyangii]|uniref:ABC transporter substrate-binding protein n=2 Tax=Boudabousia liubingyangii TaxID=1921764 RepID=A0A1Q5PLU2_9ACTO|nr:ABC transporter substrate-binding protein [Boudabousia liubingyangii]OKL48035.1 ABC transporter substrate-binding protein [Boudabousia liubingyangii]